MPTIDVGKTRFYITFSQSEKANGAVKYYFKLVRHLGIGEFAMPEKRKKGGKTTYAYILDGTLENAKQLMKFFKCEPWEWNLSDKYKEFVTNLHAGEKLYKKLSGIVTKIKLVDPTKAKIEDYKFKTEPWSHQKIGFLLIKYIGNLLLTWDMRTGKTFTVANGMQYYIQQRRATFGIVLCPKGIMESCWIRDVYRHTSLQGLALTPESTRGRLALMGQRQITVPHGGDFQRARGKPNYLVLNHDAIRKKEILNAILEMNPDMLIVDECIDPSTKIITPDGNIKIDDLNVGDEVVTPFGTTAKIKWKKYTEQISYEYETKSGRKLIASPNHLVLGTNKYKKYPTVGRIDQSRALMVSKITTTAPKPSSNLYYFLGMFIGDGHLMKYGKGVKIRFCWRRGAEEMAKILKRVVGTTQESYNKRGDLNITLTRRCSELFAKKFGFKPGKKANDVKIPECVKKEHFLSVIQGLFDTDGYRTRDCVGYSSTSKVLIEQIGEFLDELSIKYSLVVKPKKKSNHHESYEIRIFGFSIRKFYRKIGFRVSRKIKPASSLNKPNYRKTFYHDPIIKVSKEKKRRLVDIELDCPMSLFMTEEGLTIHNSHGFKNPSAARTKAALKIAKKVHGNNGLVICMSGTPVAKDIRDIYAQAQIVDPNIFPYTFTAFKKKYCKFKPGFGPQLGKPKENQIEIVTGFKNYDELKERYEPRSHKVIIEDCHDMPEKIYSVEPIVLTPEQRRHHDELLEDLITTIKDQTIDTTALSKFTKLVQLTSGYIYDKEGNVIYLKKNPKLEALREILEQTLAMEKRKIVVWTNYRPTVKILRELFHSMKIKYAELTTQSEMSRNEAEYKFQTDESYRVMLSTPSLSEGKDFSRASYAIYFDNNYRYVHRYQSEARTYTPTSKEHGRVAYVDLIGKDTVDELIMESLRGKEEVNSIITEERLRKYFKKGKK